MTQRLISILLVIAVFAIGVTPLASASPATISLSGGKISLTAENEPLRDVLLSLGKQLGVNIVVEPNVQGKVSVSLHDATLDEALSALTAPLGYQFHHSGRLVVVGLPPAQRLAQPAVSESPTPNPAVLAMTVISVDRAAAILQRLFPRAQISLDRPANAVIVVASPDQVQAMRAVLQGIDVQNPTRATTEVVQVHTVDPRAVVARLQALYPGVRLIYGPNKTIIIVATPMEMSQVKAVIASIDTSIATPPPTYAPAEAIKVLQARAQDVARVVAREFPTIRANVVGLSVVVSGPPDDIAKAKTLIALLDQPQASARFTQVYRLRSVDAKSVGDLITRSFPDAQVTTDEDLNAISVLATASEQQRITDAIAQLDGAPGSSGAGPPVAQPGAVAQAGVGSGGTSIEVITLKAALPGISQGASTSANDIASAVTQTLQQAAPDLRITVPNNSTQLVLSGNPYSIRLAKQLIDKLDVMPPLVVLDTEVLEVSETVAKNLGIQFPGAILTTTYSEIPPAAPPTGGTPPPLLGIQPFTRTAVSFTAQVNFLIQNGSARVLADPRITTVSGRTATIRAGDNFAILVTTGGGAGTVPSTTVQNFPTGVTLDITPVVNFGESISVTVHPNVSSLSGINNGVPQISTRETSTTVTLQDNQTLVIGGLIQENTTRTENKLPLLGDLPLVGRLFRNQLLSHSRNELIIVVTPHIVRQGESSMPGPALPAMPTPRPLPTLPPNAQLPPPAGQLPMPGGSPAPVQTPLSFVAATPAPTPTAFSSTNVYVFGSPPPNNYAPVGGAVQIFYASLSPTVVKNGTVVHVAVITTTNASIVTLATGSVTSNLQMVGPGQWQGTFPFNGGISALGQQRVTLNLTAARSDGLSASIQIPVSVSQ